MEGICACRKGTLDLQRGFEVSRLESELLADAYKRVLPQRLVELMERQPAAGQPKGQACPAPSRCTQLPESVIQSSLPTIMEGSKP